MIFKKKFEHITLERSSLQHGLCQMIFKEKVEHITFERSSLQHCLCQKPGHHEFSHEPCLTLVQTVLFSEGRG